MVHTFFGQNYLTTKEASTKYGYSVSWFEQRRIDNNGPPYMQMEGKGKVYYSEKDLEAWFKTHMVEK